MSAVKSLESLAAEAATFLFAPGTRPELFAKAASAGADATIIDLEDAVPDNRKQGARADVTAFLSKRPSMVRINAEGTPWHNDDLEAIGHAAGLQAVVLPKSESVETLANLNARLAGRVPIIALIESALGALRAADIARAPGVSRLMFGNLDYSSNLGLPDRGGSYDALLGPRTALAMASAAAGLPGPVDGVHPDVADAAGLETATRQARALGFTGKLCIHPSQIRVVKDSLAPSEELLRWAERVLEIERSSGGQAALLDTEMVDRPQYARARAILRFARGQSGSHDLEST